MNIFIIMTAVLATITWKLVFAPILLGVGIAAIIIIVGLFFAVLDKYNDNS